MNQRSNAPSPQRLRKAADSLGESMHVQEAAQGLYAAALWIEDRLSDIQPSRYERTISALAELAKAAEPFIVRGVDGYAHLCMAKELIAEDDIRRLKNEQAPQGNKAGAASSGADFKATDSEGAELPATDSMSRRLPNNPAVAAPSWTCPTCSATCVPHSAQSCVRVPPSVAWIATTLAAGWNVQVVATAPSAATPTKGDGK